MRINLSLRMSSLAVISFAGFLCGCGLLQPQNGGQTVSKITPGLVAQNKGKVILVLLGMDGCPGTRTATSFMAEYSKSRPDGVVVCRVDVPVSGKSLERANNVDPAINYVMDDNRAIAGWFDFFFYPTLYIVDKEGVVRFAGGCEPEKVRTMVSEMLAEAPGVPKKMYTPPLINAGEVIPDFKIKDADGRETSLDALCKKKGAMLLFSATTCGFSVSSLSDFEKLKKEYSDKLDFVIVAFGEDGATVKDLYSKKSPGSLVLVDADKSISSKYFSVSAVPFFYMLDKSRSVVERRPFVYNAAQAAILRALGKTSSGCGDTDGAG